jgi:hypothetical protein
MNLIQHPFHKNVYEMNRRRSLGAYGLPNYMRIQQATCPYLFARSNRLAGGFATSFRTISDTFGSSFGWRPSSFRVRSVHGRRRCNLAGSGRKTSYHLGSSFLLRALPRYKLRLITRQYQCCISGTRGFLELALAQELDGSLPASFCEAPDVKSIHMALGTRG